MPLYTPSTHPQDSIIGRTFKSWEGLHYTCDSYDETLGYWMFRTDGNGILVRRNVSKRAIGSSFRRATEEN